MGASSGLEAAHIFRAFGAEFRAKRRGKLARHHLRAMRAIECCRTAALGGHVWECDACGARKISYNSCRNRHCPKCQSLEKERWLAARCEELLPVPYFHVVFTLPAALHPLALRNQRLLYDLLFHCAADTLLQIAADPKHLGARIGVLAVLHTWGQALLDHPHLHCIVPGGGLALDGRRWIGCRRRFLLPIRVLATLFRGKVLHHLRAAYEAGTLRFAGTIQPLAAPAAFAGLLDTLYAKRWVVYSKPPFGGPRQVLQYLARYTHRVAISNDRLVRREGDHVAFTFRDYAHGQQIREMTLSAEEFIRRFLLHILPERFVRIRYYGLLANRHRDATLARCRTLLGRTQVQAAQTAARQDWRDLLLRLTGADPTLCPRCGEGHLHQVQELPPHRPTAAGSAGRAPP